MLCWGKSCSSACVCMSLELKASLVVIVSYAVVATGSFGWVGVEVSRQWCACCGGEDDRDSPSGLDRRNGVFVLFCDP